MCAEKAITVLHFFIPSHADIYQVLRQLWLTEQPIDFITLTQILRDRGKLDECGGAAFVTELFTFLPTAANAAYYLDILEEKLVLRELIKCCTAYSARGYDEQDDVPKLLNGILAELENIGRPKEKQIESLTPSIIAGIETKLQSRAIGAEPEGLMTGIEALDNDMGGILPARYYVLAAAEKLGKTALSEQIMQRLMSDGHAVLSFQRDMNVRMMVERMACREAGLVFSDFDTNRLCPASIGAFRKALLGFNPELLRIHSPHAMTPADMRAILKHELRRRKIAVVFLDVFTRLKVGHDYVEGLARASDEIRQMVADFGVPWIVLAHVSRESEKGEGRPQIRHLKWCKGLAGDADSVGIMWSDEDPRLKENKNRRQLVYLSFDANRGNDVGDMELYFDRPRMKFHGTRD